MAHGGQQGGSSSGESSRPAAPHQLEWLRDMVSRDLSAIIRQAPSIGNTFSTSSNCLLSEIGDFLVDAHGSISRIAMQIVESPQIANYIRGTIQESDRALGFSDTALVEYLDQKYAHLQSLEGSISNSNVTLRDNWSLAPEMPTRKNDAAKAASEHSPADFDVQSQHSESSIVNNDLAQGMAQTSFDSESQPARAALHNRGNGTYNCPLGEECTRGGVSSDGELVVFHRNSEFRAHMQKHDKPFKCDLPGCRNQKGFARIDQLRRHQESVKHGR